MARSKGRTSGISFSTPPPQRRAPYDWDAVAADLRSRPNEWALVFEQGKHYYVSAIRNGAVTALRSESGFNYRTTNNVQPTATTPRLCDLWMVYVPADDSGRDQHYRCGATTKRGRSCLTRVRESGDHCHYHGGAT